MTSLLLTNDLTIGFNRNIMVTKVIMWLQVFRVGITKIVVKTKFGDLCGTLLIQIDQEGIPDPSTFCYCLTYFFQRFAALKDTLQSLTFIFFIYSVHMHTKTVVAGHNFNHSPGVFPTHPCEHRWIFSPVKIWIADFYPDLALVNVSFFIKLPYLFHFLFYSSKSSSNWVLSVVWQTAHWRRNHPKLWEWWLCRRCPGGRGSIPDQRHPQLEK